jgi:hypothetical protein
MSSQVPTRSPSHRELDFARLAPLGLEVEEVAGDEPVTLEALTEIANDRGRPVSHYVVATALATEVPFATSEKIQAVFCAGKCQMWGALDCIDRAAELREARGGFDVVARTCLDRCANAAVCEIRTPDGTAVITEATPDRVAAAIEEALGA